MISKSIFILLGSLGAGGFGSESILYEVKPGSEMGRYTCDDVTHEVIILDLQGTLLVEIMQQSDGIGGKIQQMNMTATYQDLILEISGSGSFSVGRDDLSENGLPGVASTALFLSVDGVPEKHPLVSELYAMLSFPNITLLGHQMTTDGNVFCYSIVVFAAPREEDRTKFFRRGEVNNDGIVDLSDAISLLESLFSAGKPIPCHDAADINNDSSIGVTDGVYLLEYQFLGGSEPPVPFRPCGIDQDTDSLDCGSEMICY